MADPAFVWDYKAAGELFLKSEGIAEVCAQTAEKMTRATGMEYRPNVFVGKRRVNAGGYQQSGGDETEYPVCPKCGDAHYHCRCSRKKRG